MNPSLNDALAGFDAEAFAKRHGGYKESRSPRSHEYLVPCPTCGSSRLRWNARKGTWQCWGHPLGAPNRTGDSLTLICLMEGCEELEALNIIFDGYIGGEAKIDHLAGKLRTEELKPKAFSLPEGCDVLSAVPEHRLAWAYLHGRGIGPDLVAYYGLRFGGNKGRYRNRIIFPVFMNRVPVFFQARAIWGPPDHLDKEQAKDWVRAHQYRKVLNPTEVSAAPYVFGYDQAFGQQHIVVTEGPADAMKCGMHAVGLLGKDVHRTPEKIACLRALGAKSFTIYFDSGEKERESAKLLAREVSTFASVFIAEPPPGYDPGKLSQAENARYLGWAQPFNPGII